MPNALPLTTVLAALSLPALALADTPQANEAETPASDVVDLNVSAPLPCTLTGTGSSTIKNVLKRVPVTYDPVPSKTHDQNAVNCILNAAGYKQGDNQWLTIFGYLNDNGAACYQAEKKCFYTLHNPKLRDERKRIYWSFTEETKDGEQIMTATRSLKGPLITSKSSERDIGK